MEELDRYKEIFIAWKILLLDFKVIAFELYLKMHVTTLTITRGVHKISTRNQIIIKCGLKNNNSSYRDPGNNPKECSLEPIIFNPT